MAREHRKPMNFGVRNAFRTSADLRRSKAFRKEIGS